MTLIPFPLQSPLTPPSSNMYLIVSDSEVCFLPPCTWRRTLSLSRGAVQVREIAPATPPATKWRHQTPANLSEMSPEMLIS